jgi:hypothetical protein
MRYRRGWGMVMDRMGSIGGSKASVQGLLCSLCRARRRAPWVGLLWAVKIVNFPHMPWDMGRGGGQRTMGGSSHEARGREGRRGRAHCQRRRKNASFWRRQIMQAKVRSFYHAAMLEA